MMKKFIAIFFASTLLVGGNIAFAQTATTVTGETDAEVIELEQKIHAILARITEMRVEIATLKEALSERNDMFYAELRFTQQLRTGSEGEEVKLLQDVLATDPAIYPEAKITGYFGPLTASAVKRLQEKLGLEAVGAVGPKTQARLNQILEEGAGKSGIVPPGLLKNYGALIIVPLLNSSGDTREGKALFSIIDDRHTQVVIQMPTIFSTTTGVALVHPAHIHVGSCGTNGAIQHPLNPVVDGKSQTLLDLSLSEILAHLPLYVNVHESAEALERIVACGNIVAPVVHWKTDTTSQGVSQTVATQETSSTPPAPTETTSVKAVDVTASNFKFSTTEISVKKGTKVELKLTVAEGFHDFVLDEFNARTAQLSGGSETISFVADKVGTFEYYCSVGSHRAMGMVGKLVVTE